MVITLHVASALSSPTFEHETEVPGAKDLVG